METSLPAFTAHNMLLPDGTKTMPTKPDLLADFQQCKAFLRTLSIFFRDRPKSEIRIADLGCLEGGHAVELARNGYTVLGIEVRQSNYEKCLYVADKVRLANLEFVKDDARNIEAYGSFDAVLCCGLLYHLDMPLAFLKTLSKVTKSLLILNTHFAQPTPNLNFILSELTENEGLPGRWLHEFGLETPLQEIEETNWAAWGNRKSFWPLKTALLNAIQSAGFPLIYEQYDVLENIYTDLSYAEIDRGSFVAAKIT